jgi:hypothetical protein
MALNAADVRRKVIEALGKQVRGAAECVCPQCGRRRSSSGAASRALLGSSAGRRHRVAFALPHSRTVSRVPRSRTLSPETLWDAGPPYGKHYGQRRTDDDGRCRGRRACLSKLPTKHTTLQRRRRRRRATSTPPSTTRARSGAGPQPPAPLTRNSHVRGQL